MSVVSGVVSRQVLPLCGNLCMFCPSLRPRSRQPVKRYKKLISDIFPRSKDQEPNVRMIGKLCDYASKNPFRIPKISELLEQRFYKELRNENFQSTKIVMSIYKKLLISCKDELPLFANSLLSIMQALLDQTGQDDMLILGCETLFHFVNNQLKKMEMMRGQIICVPLVCKPFLQWSVSWVNIPIYPWISMILSQ